MACTPCMCTRSAYHACVRTAEVGTRVEVLDTCSAACHLWTTPLVLSHQRRRLETPIFEHPSGNTRLEAPIWGHLSGSTRLEAPVWEHPVFWCTITSPTASPLSHATASPPSHANAAPLSDATAATCPMRPLPLYLPGVNPALTQPLHAPVGACLPGNAHGHGRVREKELQAACAALGVPSERVTVIDDPQVGAWVGARMAGWTHGLVARVDGGTLGFVDAWEGGQMDSCTHGQPHNTFPHYKCNA
eukprot:364834-Chlamydomonas_euryale.AAC.1